MMKRREFITLLGCAATAWPLAARAQQAAMPVIGYLGLSSPETGAISVASFRQGLGEAGYVEGRNVTIEFRWAQNERDRLPELAADLVRRRVAIIVSTPLSAALAAKAVTTTIPIVFGASGDPVRSGLVASLNRPGGNVTGASDMNIELGAKRLGVLHELLPRAARFALLVNPTSPTVDVLVRDAQSAASAIGRQIEILTAGTNREIDAAFANLVQKRIDALAVTPEILFVARRIQILTLAARHAVPAIYSDRTFAQVGGLMSYGTSLPESYRQVGIYTGRVLKGEKPSDLPVMLATKFEFVINLQTAKVLGIDVPPTLLAQADEVIE
jgi:putative tryptophan/tyrosine transport system substrate-binding protein